jgi:hypothetical protein
MFSVNPTLRRTVVITVHNQYPGIELLSPVHFCNRCTHYECHSKRIGDDNMVKIEFRYDFDQDKPGAILMYGLQGEAGSNHRSSTNKVIEDASKMVGLLVAWRIERSRKLKVNKMLVEYSDELVLDEDKLGQLYDKINDLLPFYTSKRTWSMSNNTTLAVVYEVVQEASLELEIAIYKRFRDSSTIEPVWIDPTR